MFRIVRSPAPRSPGGGAARGQHDNIPRQRIISGSRIAMPTYSYLCSDCGHRFDTVQRMSEDPLTDCPACQKPALVRQVSAVGFALKGSGWYVTDFRDKGKPKKADGDAAPSTPPASTESTPAPAADSAPKAAASGD